MKTILISVTLMMSAASVFAEDTNGKALHEENCTSCHDSGVYIREDRVVRSREALLGQVRRCEANAELRWFDEDVDAVVGYLDRTYYKFGDSQ